MGPIGFSTGALAKGDFERGVNLQDREAITAIELSVLREHEVASLVAGWRRLDLSRFEYVSVHAPSKLSRGDDSELLESINDLPEQWPVIAHPEILLNDDAWRGMGARLCIENMDHRKAAGRTPQELRLLFDRFPRARFCLDLGHARQIDPTMASALKMIREFGTRLAQIHVSEVGSSGEHLPSSALALLQFQLVARHIPQDCPIIIESVVSTDRIDRELENIRMLFDGGAPESTSIQQIAATAV